MARFEMDRDGVASVRAAVSGDPALLREAAEVVAVASATARVGMGSGQPQLAAELDRFRLVHARLLDAMGDAVAALCAGIDLAVRDDRETELAAAAALGSLAGAPGRAAVVGA
ncbi:MAG TPA: hypothetical protein VFL38_10925 [Humibacillus xanthopallidus]|nr:hypothetical protein [Humibacillus xanthopallidus]